MRWKIIKKKITEGGGLKLRVLKLYGMQDEQTQEAIEEARGTRWI